MQVKSLHVLPGQYEGIQTRDLHTPKSTTIFVKTVHTFLCHLDLLSLCMQTPNFHKLSAISLLAAVMSIGYSTIAIGVSAHAGKQPGTEYNLDGYTLDKGLFGIFNSLGTIAFAYGGHNVVMEIQATIPSRPTAAKPNPTCAPMMVRSRDKYETLNLHITHPYLVHCPRRTCLCPPTIPKRVFSKRL